MRRLILAALAVVAIAAPAAADDWVPPVEDAATRKECGHCHMAFQPALLPARSWARMMDNLADHFGDDASLPAETAKAIRDYMTFNAGDRVWAKTARKFMRWVDPDGAPQLITENPEFLREHRKIRASEWIRPEVVTKSNCPACHQGAEQGWYDDD